MPVLISASIEESSLVLELAKKLLEEGGEVRCYLDDDDYRLRDAGCKLAIGELDDDMNLSAALTNVHTFMPVLPDPVRLTEADSKMLERIANAGSAAAADAKIQQTIISVPRFPAASGPVAKSFTRAAKLYQERCSPLIAIQTPLVSGPNCGLGQLPAPGVSEAGSRRAKVVDEIDWVSSLAAADDREGVTETRVLGGREVVLDYLLSTRELPAWLEGALFGAGAEKN